MTEEASPKVRGKLSHGDKNGCSIASAVRDELRPFLFIEEGFMKARKVLAGMRAVFESAHRRIQLIFFLQKEDAGLNGAHSDNNGTEVELIGNLGDFDRLADEVHEAISHVGHAEVIDVEHCATHENPTR